MPDIGQSASIIKTSIIDGIPIWWELAKLLLQFIGALIVAKLTVSWALRRYKSEKLWERKVLAYAEMIDSFNVVLKITDDWLTDEMEGIRRSDEFNSQRGQSYASAKRSLYSSLALGELMFSTQLTECLKDCLHKIDSSTHDFFQEELEFDLSLLKQAKELVMVEGREIFKIR